MLFGEDAFVSRRSLVAGVCPDDDGAPVDVAA
jgi:hypothetical protein